LYLHPWLWPKGTRKRKKNHRKEKHTKKKEKKKKIKNKNTEHSIAPCRWWQYVVCFVGV